MYELRYLVQKGLDNTKKVLQYRTQIEFTDYSSKTDDGRYISIKKWAEWQNVPIIDETK